PLGQGARRLHPEPRDRGQRRALHARSDRGPDRRGAALLPHVARARSARGRAAHPPGLLRAGARADPGGVASGDRDRGGRAEGGDRSMKTLAPVDFAAIRKQFPIFDRKIHGHPLVYLDSTATTQKPIAVLDALERYYRTYNANIHRGVYVIGEE